VVALDGAWTLWLAAPPSDHAEKTYVVPLSVCGVGALIEFCELTITVLVNRAIAVEAFKPSLRPEELLTSVRATVLGFKVMLAELSVPEESLAVRLICSEDGYSWSGAKNDPFVIPVNVWMVCVTVRGAVVQYNGPGESRCG
jgi:hypothetical protein